MKCHTGLVSSAAMTTDIFETDDPYDPDAAAADGSVIVDDWDDEDEEAFFNDPNRYDYVLKWVCDGAESIDDVVAMLGAQVEWFKEQKVGGWELDHPVDNGWIILRRAADSAP